MNLVDCEYRIPVPLTNQLSCEHPLVTVANGIVNPAICRSCHLAGPRQPHLKPIRRNGYSSRSLFRASSVAIVIPCHNYGRYLAQAIESCLNQLHAASEILVIVDRSDDDSTEIADRFRAEGVRTICVDYGNVHKVRHRGFQETS